MQDKKLSDQEYLAIDSILEDAERKYLPKNSVAFDLESLDQQCRDIWSDWDFSVPTISKSPIDSTKKINIDLSYQSQKYRNEINPSSLSSDDDVNTSNSENIRKVVRNSQFKQNSITKAQNLDESDSDSKDSSEDLSSDSEIIRKPPKSPMRSPLILSGRYSGSKSKSKSRKKSPFKSSINSTTKSLNRHQIQKLQFMHTTELMLQDYGKTIYHFVQWFHVCKMLLIVQIMKIQDLKKN